MEVKSDLLELEARRRIYDELVRAPGLHMRKLQRDLGMAIGTLEYHLRQMERGQLVTTRRVGRLKAFFANDGLDRRDRDAMYYLRQRMPRWLAMEIVNQPGVSFQQLLDRVPINASTLSFHLKKLRAGALIEESRNGTHKLYFPVEPDRLRRLVMRYRETFVDAVVDRFAEAWLDLEP